MNNAAYGGAGTLSPRDLQSQDINELVSLTAVDDVHINNQEFINVLYSQIDEDPINKGSQSYHNSPKPFKGQLVPNKKPPKGYPPLN